MAWIFVYTLLVMCKYFVAVVSRLPDQRATERTTVHAVFETPKLCYMIGRFGNLVRIDKKLYIRFYKQSTSDGNLILQDQK